MVTNIYFSNFDNLNEQNLLADLAEESIQAKGINCPYLPKNVLNEDPLYREATLNSFTKAYFIEMYIKDVQGFTGDGKFLSKFGLEIRDEITLCVSRRAFAREVGTDLFRPQEGDLIYIPLNKKCFQIKFVNHEALFYQLGGLYFYELTCEVFEYANETFATGLSYVDDRYNSLSTSDLGYELLDQSGNIITDEQGNPIITDEYVIDDITENAQNEEIVKEADVFLDFSEADPFGVGRL